jgi:hypothetical protein
MASSCRRSTARHGLPSSIFALGLGASPCGHANPPSPRRAIPARALASPAAEDAGNQPERCRDHFPDRGEDGTNDSHRCSFLCLRSVATRRSGDAQLNSSERPLRRPCWGGSSSSGVALTATARRPAGATHTQRSTQGAGTIPPPMSSHGQRTAREAEGWDGPTRGSAGDECRRARPSGPASLLPWAVSAVQAKCVRCVARCWRARLPKPRESSSASSRDLRAAPAL